MFLPTTKEELLNLGWEGLDVILVSGDSYIDSPFIGVSIIGKILLQAGYRVGFIAQPDITSGLDINRLGEPKLFWGVTGGSIDSMIANYTATKKRRRSDDYTPGGINNRRPDRAVIAYANLIRHYFKQTRPIVLGGIEASLRRIPHYDYWSDRVRGSILFDAKADFILYGMAEKSVLEFAKALSSSQNTSDIRGLCFISKERKDGFIELPPFEKVAEDKATFIQMFQTFYKNTDPHIGKGLCQQHGNRWLIQNPPPLSLSQGEMDAIYEIEYERQQHPYYSRIGKVKALETIRFAIPTHRGCYGECNFCAISVHEGRTVQWRSKKSIIKDARILTKLPDFKGFILDISGPTANMYGFECTKKLKNGSCVDKRCLYPDVCPLLKPDHKYQTDLLKELRKVPGVKKIFIASGIRYDMILADQVHGESYLHELVEHHVSGQLKVAPEHSEKHILDKMGKPGADLLLEFKRRFDISSKQAKKRQFLTYYLLAAYPGCSEADMHKLQRFVSKELKIHPEQVQIFTPIPSTYASVMYYTEMDPISGDQIFVEKDIDRKQNQKKIIVDQ